jgi:hypothetical protein
MASYCSHRDASATIPIANPSNFFNTHAVNDSHLLPTK